MPSVDLQVALALVRDRLTERTLRHCEAAASEARSLASIYGMDPDEAYLGGLLHDLARDVPGATLLEKARAFGIAIDSVDVAAPHLLHAQVGAAELKSHFPTLSEDVLEAIRKHTLGSVSMGPLDMIIYIADMIEPSRPGHGAQNLRSAKGSMSLFELYAAAYQASFTQLVKSYKHLHPTTVEAWNFIVDGLDFRMAHDAG